MSRSTAVRRLLALAAILLLAVLAAPATGVAAGPAWTIVKSPTATGPEGNLEAISCSSATDCTAVGNYANKSGKTVTLAEQWNGTSWAMQTTPNPTGAIQSILSAVSCPSATACFAVGSTTKTLSGGAPLAEMWNGTSWTLQAVTNPTGSISVLNGIACLSSAACMAVGSSNHTGTVTGLTESWNGTAWTMVPSPNPSGSSYTSLAGVSCASSTDCSAVGNYSSNTGQVTLAEAWNGASWTIQSTPNPAGSNAAFLNGVACASSSMCEAAGYGVDSSGNNAPLAEGWNGSTWAIQTTPIPASAITTTLAGIACPSSSYCTAVGTWSNSSAESTLAESWDGSTWTIQATPNPTGAVGSGLTAVACSSASACIASGDFFQPGGLFGPIGNAVTFAESWNGTTWALQATVNPTGPTVALLHGVSCSSSTSCIAVGEAQTRTHGRQSYALAWNGTSWAVQKTPVVKGASISILTGVSCSSSTACEAVGLLATSTGTQKPLAEAWNGVSWSTQTVPFPPGATDSSLAGVSCASSTRCVAVGEVAFSSASQPLAATWNGSTWSDQALSPPSGTSTAILGGVSCPSSTQCTAVGFAIDSITGNVLPLVEAWNGTSWSTQTAATPTGSVFTDLASVSCSSATACTAVGSWQSSGGAETGLAEGWDGTTWMLETFASPAGAVSVSASGVSCSSATACEAVGGWGGNTTSSTLAEVWDGSAWTVQTTPSPMKAFPGLRAISCVGTSPCYAVGSFEYTSAAVLTLIESFS